MRVPASPADAASSKALASFQVFGQSMPAFAKSPATMGTAASSDSGEGSLGSSEVGGHHQETGDEEPGDLDDADENDEEHRLVSAEDEDQADAGPSHEQHAHRDHHRRGDPHRPADRLDRAVGQDRHVLAGTVEAKLDHAVVRHRHGDRQDLVSGVDPVFRVSPLPLLLAEGSFESSDPTGRGHANRTRSVLQVEVDEGGAIAHRVPVGVAVGVLLLHLLDRPDPEGLPAAERGLGGRGIPVESGLRERLRSASGKDGAGRDADRLGPGEPFELPDLLDLLGRGRLQDDRHHEEHRDEDDEEQSLPGRTSIFAIGFWHVCRVILGGRVRRGRRRC